jgi:hypothetical protein
MPILVLGNASKVSDIPQAVLSLSGNLQDNGYYTSDVEASLYISGENSDAYTIEYSLYNQGWTNYEQPFTIYEEGQTVIYYRVRNDQEDFIGETKFSMVDIDKTPPIGSITIDNNLKETFGLKVTLTISAIDEPSGPTTLPPSGYIWGVPSGPSVMRFSNNGIAWSPWEPISEEKAWQLNAGQGIKTVYAQIRDNAGLVSETLSDDISLNAGQDKQPPTTKILINGKQDSSAVYAPPVTLSFNAVDDLSGVSFTEYSFDNSSWITYKSAVPIEHDGTITIYYKSQDVTGNIEPIATYTLIIEQSKADDGFPFALVWIFVSIFIVSSFTIAIYFKSVRRKSD